LVARRDLGLDRAQAQAMAKTMIGAYAGALSKGRALWIEREIAKGTVRRLLKDRSRKQLLDKETRTDDGGRTFRPDGDRRATKKEKLKVHEIIDKFARSWKNASRFTVIDVCWHVAGTGSLGVENYAILIEGDGSPNRNELLDLKQAMPSSMMLSLRSPQPEWK